MCNQSWLINRELKLKKKKSNRYLPVNFIYNEFSNNK